MESDVVDEVALGNLAFVQFLSVVGIRNLILLPSTCDNNLLKLNYYSSFQFSNSNSGEFEVILYDAFFFCWFL